MNQFRGQDSAFQPEQTLLSELEPVFDAANVLRVGGDLLYLVSDGGNLYGVQWLQTFLGSEYRGRAYDNIYTDTHVDTIITWSSEFAGAC